MTSTSEQIVEMLIDQVAPGMWPPAIERLADQLNEIVPGFDRDRFVRRAIENWEDAQNVLMMDAEDQIPY